MYDEEYYNTEKTINYWEKEITPVPQFSPEITLLKIHYTKEEEKIMDIFRAVFLSKEISLRVYNLTTEVIS